MVNLHLLDEIVTNGSNYFFLDIVSTIAVLSGILVIVSKNPIVSVLFLIVLFLSIASYLMMLGINFIGLSYLLVYVGAVSILFLFILMLINVRISELATDSNNSIPLAIVIGVIFNTMLYEILPINKSVFSFGKFYYNFIDFDNISSLTKYTENISSGEIKTAMYNKIVFVSSQTWDANLAETSHITSLGNIIYTSYPIWLIITSLVLLLAMVGAIVITIKQKN